MKSVPQCFEKCPPKIATAPENSGKKRPYDILKAKKSKSLAIGYLWLGELGTGVLDFRFITIVKVFIIILIRKSASRN